MVVAAEIDGDARTELIVLDTETGRYYILNLSSAGSPTSIQNGYWTRGWTSLIPVEIR